MSMFYKVIAVLVVIALFYIYFVLRHIGETLYMLTKNVCTIGEIYNKEINKQIK